VQRGFVVESCTVRTAHHRLGSNVLFGGCLYHWVQGVVFRHFRRQPPRTVETIGREWMTVSLPAIEETQAPKASLMCDDPVRARLRLATPFASIVACNQGRKA
jgi:hypothetical protein